MPNTSEKEVKDIKAGVEGVLSDAPEPTEDMFSETTEEYATPKTTYDEEGRSFDSPPEYSEPPLQDLGAPQSVDTERIHEVIEAIIDEKWDGLMGKVGNVIVWKEKVNNDVVAIKQELVRIEENFRQLQNAILGRVKDYDQGIRGIHVEMKALEKVFEKILEPLTTNIKDLTRITQDLKKLK